MILAAFVVFAGCAMIAVQLVEINKTLKMIIKRYAALENLGLFPEEDSELTEAAKQNGESWKQHFTP